MWKEAVVPNLGYCPGNCLEGLRKTTILNHGSRSRGRDFDPGPPEYEAGVITSRPWLSVSRCLRCTVQRTTNNHGGHRDGYILRQYEYKVGKVTCYVFQHTRSLSALMSHASNDYLLSVRVVCRAKTRQKMPQSITQLLPFINHNQSVTQVWHQVMWSWSLRPPVYLQIWHVIITKRR
jgi:hypothetical protein